MLFADIWKSRSIMNIDEAAGLMDLDLTLTLYWRDKRVFINGTTKKAITINPEQDDLLKNIWLPDIAIDQAVFFHFPANFENCCRQKV